MYTRLCLLLLPLLTLGCDPYPLEFSPPRPAALSLPGIDERFALIRNRPAAYPVRHYFSEKRIVAGCDEYGYDYTLRSYKGFFSNRNRGPRGLPPVESGDVRLEMLWNDAWLSNVDRDGNGSLDRHYGFRNYRGSGAWLTVHLEGVENGETWVYFMKAAAVPERAQWENGRWIVDGTDIGPAIWGCFAILMEFSTSRKGYEQASEFKRRFPGLGLE